MATKPIRKKKYTSSHAEFEGGGCRSEVVMEQQMDSDLSSLHLLVAVAMKQDAAEADNVTLEPEHQSKGVGTENGKPPGKPQSNGDRNTAPEVLQTKRPRTTIGRPWSRNPIADGSASNALPRILRSSIEGSASKRSSGNAAATKGSSDNAAASKGSSDNEATSKGSLRKRSSNNAFIDKRSSSKEAFGKGSSSKQASGEVSSSKQASGKGSSSKQATDTGSSSKQASSKGSSSKQSSGKGSSSKQASDTGSSSKQASGKGSSIKQASGTGASSKQASNTGSSSKPASGKGSSSKQASGTGASRNRARNGVLMPATPGKPSMDLEGLPNGDVQRVAGPILGLQNEEGGTNKSRTARKVKSSSPGLPAKPIKADDAVKALRAELGFTGIHFYRRTGKWSSHLWWRRALRRARRKRNLTTQEKGKQPYLGAYFTVSETARAYDKARLQARAKNGQPNYPESDYIKDLPEMKKRTSEQYVKFLQTEAKKTKIKKVAEGVHICPEGWYEARLLRFVMHKGKREPYWRFLGRFRSLEDAQRSFKAADEKFPRNSKRKPVSLSTDGQLCHG